MKFTVIQEGQPVYSTDKRQSKINKDVVVKPKRQSKGKLSIHNEIKGMFKNFGC